MYVTQCVQLGATLDVRFMIDFQPEEALEPRVLYVVAEQVSDASRCAQFLLDRREGNESVHLTRAGNTLTVTSAGGIFEQIRRTELKAEKHDQEGAAGVLYAQHLAFMKRLLLLLGA